MLRPTLLLTTLTLIAGAAAQLAPQPQGSIDLALAKQRIRALQVQANDLRHARPRKARRAGQSPVPQPPCQYCGENPGGPGECKKNGGGSDGCNDNCYTVSPSSLSLAGNRKFKDGDDFNFKYIPYDQYKGVGSYLNQQPGWTVKSANVHFEKLNNQPSGAYIGQGSIHWNALVNLPSQGFCIIWVQVHDCNQHYGENKRGPVCFAPGYTPSIGNTGGNTGTPGNSGNPGNNGNTGNSGPSTAKADAFGVCDQWGWDKPKTCRDGYACVGDVWQKKCQMRNDFACNRQYQQCGGAGYKGVTCCPESGWECKANGPSYSQCVEKPYKP